MIAARTTSLCEQCLRKVDATINIEGSEVFLKKQCTGKCVSQGQPTTTLIADDAAYFMQCFIQAEAVQNRIRQGSGQRIINLAILELLDECNMKCPTCIAASYPGKGNVKSIEKIARMVEVSSRIEPHPETLMLSGGEPTVHPDIDAVIRLACESSVRRVMLITNGVRIATDSRFVETLASYKERLEVYLQFDSLRPEVLLEIRGEDLVSVRTQAISALEAVGVHSTLVCVVKKGLNETEVGDVVEFAKSFRFVRGVTFQPIKATGRHTKFDKNIDSITLTEVRRNLIEGNCGFHSDDLVPHPVNPLGITIGYQARRGGSYEAVTKKLFEPEVFRRVLRYASKCISFLTTMLIPMCTRTFSESL